MKSFRTYLTVPVVLALMGLAACGDSDEVTDDVATTVAEATTAPTTPDSEPNETTATEETTPPTEETSPPTEATSAPTEAPAPAASPLADFEEYAVLESTIDDLDSLTPEIETDNPNTRVILYSNADGRKVYKSIFVKRGNRLKIINIDGGGPPLYNDPI